MKEPRLATVSDVYVISMEGSLRAHFQGEMRKQQA